MTEQESTESDESPYRSPASDVTGLLLCPDCHAEVPLDAQTCWMCGRTMNVRMAEPVTRRVPQASPVSFSLASLMTVVTLIAVGLGLFVTAPGLGILYSVALVPALVRTAVGVKRRASAGQNLAVEQKLQLFATSLAVSVAAGVAGVVAFFATCFSTCFLYFQVGNNSFSNSDSFFVFSSILAGGLALFAFGIVFYLFRTGRRKK